VLVTFLRKLSSKKSGATQTKPQIICIFNK